MDQTQKQPAILVSPSGVPTDAFDHLPPLVAPKDDPKLAVGCDDLPEPLVPIVDSQLITYLDAYDRWGALPPRPARLRSGAFERLQEAAASLPPGFGLVVLDSWRTIEDQQALAEFYGSQSIADGFLAPTTPGYIPPHTTGGAVDLTLSFEGRPLALGTEFDAFVDQAATDAFEADGCDFLVRQLRRGLAAAMSGAGFAPYWREWWHWSWGDDRWARINKRTALYKIAEL